MDARARLSIKMKRGKASRLSTFGLIEKRHYLYLSFLCVLSLIFSYWLCDRGRHGLKIFKDMIAISPHA